MRPVSIPVVMSVGAVGAIISFAVSFSLVRSGGDPFLVTPLLAAFFVLLAAWLLFSGRAVQKFKRREDTWIGALGATRTAVLARASAYVGALFTGVLLGVAVTGFTRMWAPAMASSAWLALAGAVAALVTTVAAVVVERWCIDDSGGDPDGARRDKRGGREPSPNAPRT